jgi:hypothetical protein
VGVGLRDPRSGRHGRPAVRARPAPARLKQLASYSLAKHPTHAPLAAKSYFIAPLRKSPFDGVIDLELPVVLEEAVRSRIFLYREDRTVAPSLRGQLGVRLSTGERNLPCPPQRPLRH